MHLRQLRLERNLSQQSLARLSRVSRITIHRVEHGRQKPRKSTIVKLARALNTRPERIAPDLFAELDKRPPIELTNELMEEILPYVKKVARRLALNTGDTEDLESAGREGVFEASRKYDPTRVHDAPPAYIRNSRELRRYQVATACYRSG
jgi:transcriptional regulator with XRE-family HTH domain